MNRSIPYVLLFLVACTPPQSKKEVSSYVDLKPFIESQIAALDARKPLVSKTILVDDQPETQQIRQINWRNELEFFLQTDIHKAAYADSYVVEEISETTTTYRLKSDENLPVQFLEVIRNEKDAPPLKVKATLRTKNYLYESERNLTFTCVNNKLSTYEIQGFQQLFYGDPEPFRIEGRIIN